MIFHLLVAFFLLILVHFLNDNFGEIIVDDVMVAYFI